MGFYAPAQLVRDAREHGVEVRPVDVNASDWDHKLEDCASSGRFSFPLAKESAGEQQLPLGNRYALRLGLRLIAGFHEEDAKKLITARQEDGLFRSPEDLMRGAKLGHSAMRILARADAFGSLNLGRRETLWHVAGFEPDELPLLHAPESFAQRALSRGRQESARDAIRLPFVREEEAVTEDYSVFGLSLRKHPMSFMREALQAKGITSAADLKSLANGIFVKIAGLVLFRQRPRRTRRHRRR